ncbi:hypothetical protein FKM82_025339, partial [Ascaphus truei]
SSFFDQCVQIRQNFFGIVLASISTARVSRTPYNGFHGIASSESLVSISSARVSRTPYNGFHGTASSESLVSISSARVSRTPYNGFHGTASSESLVSILSDSVSRVRRDRTSSRRPASLFMRFPCSFSSLLVSNI